MRSLLRDFRFALRRLRSSPLFFLFAVLTLGVGIGVTTATYSALYRTFWRPLGIVENDRVYWLGAITGSRGNVRGMSALDLRDLRESQTAFSSIQATASFPGAVAANGRAALVSSEAVSGGYFTTLGVRPFLGRVLQPSDDDPSAPAAAVISETFWRTHFAGDPTAVGGPIKIGGRVFELVGVAQRRFNGIGGMAPITDVWVPLASADRVFTRFAGELGSPNRNRTWLKAFGRLNPSGNADEASAQLTAIAARLDAEAPINYRGPGDQPVKSPRTWRLARVGERFNWYDLQMMRLILMVPLLVLLIACTNLTNLVLSRGSSRAHEFAVRRALGCSRLQLIRDQLIEGSLIAAAGSVAGVAIARGLLTAVDAMVTDAMGNWPRLRIEMTMEPSILVAVLGAALLALFVAGLVPALELTRSKRSRALGVDSPGAAPPRWRGRSNLIALQVGASVALFLMSSMFVREILEDEVSPSGMQLERTALVNVPFDTALMDEPAARRGIARVLNELQRTPGVHTAAATVLWDRPGRISLARITTADGRFFPDYYEYVPATGRLFDVLGVSLREGRTFSEHDDAGTQPVAIINESLAALVFGTRHAIGRELPVRLHLDRGAAARSERRQLVSSASSPTRTTSEASQTPESTFHMGSTLRPTWTSSLAQRHSMTGRSRWLSVRSLRKSFPMCRPGTQGPRVSSRDSRTRESCG